ncbi:MarR family winged helix-turn-helix transcriptional regulator [Bacillus salitolerans]|uniref:MarR family winged helix-turn-helix transcriptional regulator n=1 Tax=Bacillus salitolerans TaxID=1437434 RepID=A0ABW4LPU2_9BACI
MKNYRSLFQQLTRRIGLLNKNCCIVDDIEVSIVQSHILYEISTRDIPSMNQIAEALGIDMSTFSRQIQKLKSMGLVDKKQHSEDKRTYILSLTPKGKYVVSSISDEMNKYLEGIFSEMSEYEKEIVVKSIHLLNESMAKSNACCKSH